MCGLNYFVVKKLIRVLQLQSVQNYYNICDFFKIYYFIISNYVLVIKLPANIKTDFIDFFFFYKLKHISA